MKNYFMREALYEAKKAYQLKEVPIGAVIVKDDEIIGRGYNKKETLKDATEHGEMRAVKRAQKALNTWHLDGCEVYVTLEPCAMCVGALLNTRVKKIYIGASNSRMGACGSAIDLTKVESFNHKIEVEFGVMGKECSELLTRFFKELREIKKLKY